MQQYFIQLTLRAEQEEYTAEGIAWSNVTYFDNMKVTAQLSLVGKDGHPFNAILRRTQVCELIEGKKGTKLPSVIELLDDETIFPEVLLALSPCMHRHMGTPALFFVIDSVPPHK